MTTDAEGGGVMGTNYYWHIPGNPCSACGHDADKGDYHIGKSSAGWTFSFHAVPELGVASYRDWLRTFAASPHGKIVDEYGREHSVADFVVLVEGKRDGKNHTQYVRAEHTAFSDDCYLDGDGHSFSRGDFS